jgi:hypothetical protein
VEQDGPRHTEGVLKEESYKEEEDKVYRRRHIKSVGEKGGHTSMAASMHY